MKVLFVVFAAFSFLLLGTMTIGVFTGSVVFAETQVDSTEVMSVSATDEIINILVTEMIGIAGIGLTAVIGLIVQWFRRQGIPVTSEQEAMFKQVVGDRFQMLAKNSWAQMREDIENDPDALEHYWKEIKTGHVPKKYQKLLIGEGKKFAETLQDNKEFRDFAKKLTGNALDRLLKTTRAKLKSDYQKRMIDVIPKLASVAVDAAFDKEVNDVETWSDNALEKMKPLLFSTESVDKEENLMLIIQSEVNKRLQQRL